MRQKRTFVTLLLVIALLCLGIAYAAIDDITLKIGGTLNASPNAANFVVQFKDNGSAEVTVGDDTQITATPTASGINANLDVSGFTAAGETVVATYTIVNNSPDLLADLSLKTSVITDGTEDNDVNDDEYFNITTEVVGADEISGKASLAADGGETTVKVTVEVVKTPIDADVSGKINVELVAEPVQPTV